MRAADEIKARELAASAFRIGAETSAAKDVPRPPWLFPRLVTCTRIEDSDFEENGPDTILGLETLRICPSEFQPNHHAPIRGRRVGPPLTSR